jgi:uncharacterized membrane protein YfcA
VGTRVTAGPRKDHRHWSAGRVLTVAVVVAALVATFLIDPVAVLAALGTGFFNTAGGGGAILTFLAVTAVGVPALTAHASSQFVTPMSFTVVLSVARRHSPGLALMATGSLGTVLGVVILKLTPPTTIQLVAPVFLLLAGLLVVVQGAVQRRVEQLGWELGAKTTTVLLFGVGVYAGLIGVGTGTLAIVVLGLTPRYAGVGLQQLLLARNVLLLGMASVVAAVFIPTGLVSWPLAAVLALPGAVGGWVGIKLVHRLPVPLLRALIAATAVAGAIWMWLR